MKRDPQRRAVYAMEAREFSGLWRGVAQPMKQLRDAARDVCKLFGVKNVAVCTRALETCGAEYDADACVIRLGTSGRDRNMVTLAHELAHHIVWCKHGHRAQDHGPTFVLAYAMVLSAMRMVPVAGMRDACKRNKVRIARCFK